MLKARLAHPVETLFARLRDQPAWRLAGGAASLASLMPACADVNDPMELAHSQAALLNSRVKDWAQREGERNTEEVQLVGQAWENGRYQERLLDCGPRGGCRTAELLLHVRVRRHQGVDLGCKRVGVIYRREGPSTQPVTVYDAEYKGSTGEWEDFHVRVRLENLWTEGTLLNVSAWYQPGEACQGKTFYDDNGGDLHVVSPLGSRPIWFMYPSQSDLTFSNDGTRGKLHFRVANLDYDKQLELHYTVDGVTWQRMSNGPAGELNNLHYAYSIGMWGNDDYEMWEADIDLPPSPTGELRLAVAYTHGLAAGATRRTVWDNNAGNDYRLAASTFSPSTP